MNLPSRLLSLREMQVLRLAAEGLTAKATAQVLHLSESAVNLYLVHARQKLGAKTKAEAIAVLMDSGAVITESIDHVKATFRKNSADQDDRLHEMLLVSNKMRHLLENMLIADAARKLEHGDQEVWNDLAERFLKMAAEACGYEVVKQDDRRGAPKIVHFGLQTCGA